jgi:hypothetical protein
VDVASWAWTVVKMSSSADLDRAIQKVVKTWRLADRTYHCVIRHDADSTLTARAAAVADVYSNVSAEPYPSGDPNLNPAERAWRHCHEAATALLVESGLGDECRLRAIAHACVHQVFLPAPSRGGRRPVDILGAGVQLYAHPDPLLVPFGAQAFSRRTAQSAPNTAATESQSKGEPAIVVGYGSPFGNGVLLWVPHRRASFTTVVRRRPTVIPYIFPAGATRARSRVAPSEPTVVEVPGPVPVLPPVPPPSPGSAPPSAPPSAPSSVTHHRRRRHRRSPRRR